jgi:hypothetical protein
MLSDCLRSSLVVIALALASPLASAQDDGPWIKDYARARAVARERGKPVFLVFRCER